MIAGFDESVNFFGKADDALITLVSSFVDVLELGDNTVVFKLL